MPKPKDNNKDIDISEKEDKTLARSGLLRSRKGLCRLPELTYKFETKSPMIVNKTRYSS